MIRTALAWLLLALETLLTWPVFLLAWFGSAIVIAGKAGYRFAALEDDDTRRATLRRMMGDKP